MTKPIEIQPPEAPLPAEPIRSFFWYQTMNEGTHSEMVFKCTYEVFDGLQRARTSVLTIMLAKDRGSPAFYDSHKDYYKYRTMLNTKRALLHSLIGHFGAQRLKACTDVSAIFDGSPLWGDWMYRYEDEE